MATSGPTLFVSRDVKYTAATDSLELGWIDALSSNHDLLVVKVQQYMVGLGHLLLPIFIAGHRVSGAMKRLLVNVSLSRRDLHLCPRCGIAEDKIEGRQALVIRSILLIDIRGL